VDDGSTDGTGEALRARYGDRIRYVWQENQGESVARNRGTEMAQGEYIALLDSDDLWLPEKLEKQAPVLEARPEVCLVFCQAWLIDSRGQRVSGNPLGEGLSDADITLEALCLQNTVVAGGSTAVIRRAVLLEIGGFDPQIRFGEDWDLWLRLRRRWDFAFLSVPLAYIRRHADTQCHLPRPDNIERRLRDAVYLLERAFDALQEPLSEQSLLRSRSLARRYAQAAFSSFAWERYVQGREWLTEAIALDPLTWREQTRLMDALVGYGMARAEVEGSSASDYLCEYVDGALAHWPHSATLPKHARRHVLGRLHAEAGYRSYLEQDFRPAWRYMGQALWTDPTLWRDRGLVRRMLSSLGSALLSLAP